MKRWPKPTMTPDERLWLNIKLSILVMWVIVAISVYVVLNTPTH